MKILANGREFFGATGGSEFDPKKPTIVLIHGSGLDHRSWALQARWFAFHGFSVFVPDFPGHSLSVGDPLASIEAMSKWLVYILNFIGCEKIHLVGHSSGFLVALEASDYLRRKLISLIAVASAASIPVNEMLIRSAFESKGDAVKMMLRWGFGMRSHMGISSIPGMQPIEIGRQIMLRNPLAVDLSACNAYSNGIKRAQNIKIPAKVIIATEDKMTPCKSGFELAELLNADVTRIHDTGHMVPIEAPEECLNAIKSFLVEFKS